MGEKRLWNLGNSFIWAGAMVNTHIYFCPRVWPSYKHDKWLQNKLSFLKLTLKMHQIGYRFYCYLDHHSFFPRCYLFVLSLQAPSTNTYSHWNVAMLLRVLSIPSSWKNLTPWLYIVACQAHPALVKIGLVLVRLFIFSLLVRLRLVKVFVGLVCVTRRLPTSVRASPPVYGLKG